MKKMSIYEPALCCETGLCGVNVDPELLRITTVLDNLKNKGIIIERYNLNSTPMEFVKNNTVNQYVNEKGVEGLPVTLVDGKIVITGRYPANDEILNLLGLPASTLLPENAISQGCCCSGEEETDCCSDVTEESNEKEDNGGCCCCGGCC